MIPQSLDPSFIGSSVPLTASVLATLADVPGLFISDTATIPSPTGAGPIVVSSYSFPTSGLGLPNEGLARCFHFRAWGVVTNNANAKTPALYFRSSAGGTLNGLAGIVIPINTSANWLLDVIGQFNNVGPVASLLCMGLGVQGPANAAGTVQLAANNFAVGIDATKPGTATVGVMAAVQTAAVDISQTGAFLAVY